MKVYKWGNSLVIRLPAAIVEILDLKKATISKSCRWHPNIRRRAKPDREEWLNRLRRFRGTLPADFKFNRDEANSR